MMAGVRIREFKPKDFEKVLSLAKEAFAEGMELWQFDIAQARKLLYFWGIVRFLQRLGRPRFRFYVAEVNGELVGTTVLERRGSYAYIEAVMVHPAHRRRGYARALVSRAMEEAFSWGLDKVVLHVRDDNIPAKNLYASLGFIPFGRTAILLWQEKTPPSEQPLPSGYELKRVKAHDPRFDSVIEASLDPKAREVLGPSKKGPLLFRVLSALFHPGAEKWWAIALKENTVGIVIWGANPPRPAIGRVFLLPSHRDRGLEEPILCTLINSTRKGNSERLFLWADAGYMKLLGAARQLGFQEKEVTLGMVLFRKERK